MTEPKTKSTNFKVSIFQGKLTNSTTAKKVPGYGTGTNTYIFAVFRSQSILFRIRTPRISFGRYRTQYHSSAFNT